MAHVARQAVSGPDRGVIAGQTGCPSRAGNAGSVHHVLTLRTGAFSGVGLQQSSLVRAGQGGTRREAAMSLGKALRWRCGVDMHCEGSCAGQTSLWGAGGLEEGLDGSRRPGWALRALRRT